ncbi:MAG: glycosyl hydrolase, partial [Cyclobacteriaceae bacterium]
MKKFFWIFTLAILVTEIGYGQQSYTSGTEILNSVERRSGNKDLSIYSNYPVRNVGPVVQGGRITDIAVNASNTKEFYVAFASGGVFRTSNNGITFDPVFDNQGALTIGDICLSPTNDQVLWVGTGENNSSRSSYAGSGVYKSSDAGGSWEFMGLEATQHIGRIIIHPDNPDIVWVAAMGNLYTHNPERGVFKTTDGGKSWSKTLYVNDSTGAIDLVINPEDPDMLWASMWERTRKAWNFKGHGPGSAIYKSTDGGDNWVEVMDGIADREFAGRIGLDISQSSPNILYALIDSQFETKTEKEREEGELLAADFVEMTEVQFLELEDEKLDDFLKNNFFPEKYDAKKVKTEVEQGKYDPKALADYLGDANTALFDTEVKGAEIYRSDDYGSTWKKTHDYDLKGVYFTYGYYFGEVRVSPADPERIYIFGVPLLRSDDGGINFSRADTIGDVHADHQAMWIDPKDPDHILLGNDGGLYMSYDGGVAWNHINNIPAGQFYTVNYDMEKPYNIYGGLQDNGILFGSSRSVPNETKNWEYLFGGDGMFVIPDPRDFNLVYVGYQFGNYYRINTRTNERKYITPRPDIGEENLRFNWRTPVVMSTHNPDIIYMGANKLFRSLDKAETWTAISEDLTKDLLNGNVPYST